MLRLYAGIVCSAFFACLSEFTLTVHADGAHTVDLKRNGWRLR
jgi:hypothetical protein